jgi:hypothetical protein
MPDVATRGFGQALTEVVRRLEGAKNDGLLRGYGLIGGFAAAAWGVPRATHDIDFALLTSSTDHQKIAEAIGAQFRAGVSRNFKSKITKASWIQQNSRFPMGLISSGPNRVRH